MHRYPRSFWLANLVNLLCLGGVSTLVHLPAYFQFQGLTRWEIGVTEGAFWLAAVAVQPALGQSLDRRGRRAYFLGGGLALTLLTAGLLVLPVDPVSTALWRAAMGAAQAVYFTAIWTWVADHAAPGHLAETLGIFGISGLLSGVLGPVLAEVVLHHRGWPYVFLTASVLGLGAVALASLLRDRPLPSRPQGRPGPYWQAAWAPGLRSPVTAALVFGLATGSLFAFLAPYLAVLKMPGVGGFFTCYVAASVLTRLFLGRLADRLGPGRLIFPSLVAMAAGLGGLALLAPGGLRGAPLLALCAILGGGGHGAIYPALNALVVERLGNTSRGTGLSMVTAAVDLGAFAGAALSGWAAHRLGYPAMFAGVGLSVVAGALGCFFLEARHRPEVAPT